MKTVFFFILILSFTSCSNKKVVYSDLENYYLQGNVKSVRKISYDVTEKFGEIVPDGAKEESTLNFGKDGMLELPSGKTRKIDRDEYGNIVKIVVYVGDSVESERFFQYDASGLLISEGKKGKGEDYEYKYRYDNKIRVERDYFRSGKFDSRTKYVNSGNKRSHKTYNAEGKLKYFGEIFRENDVVRKALEYSADSILQEAFEYDKHGFVIKYKMGDPISIEYEYQNEYDKRGNIIKQIKLEDDKPMSVRTWEIEYFD